MAKKVPQEKKPTVGKKELVAAIRKRLKIMDLPNQMYVEKWEHITNVRKFFESHLSIVENTNTRAAEPYADRLKRTLKALNVDINEIAKEILAKKKKS